MSSIVHVTRILKPEDVTALASNPIALIPGQPDRWYYPLFFRFRKTKGEAFIISAPTAQIGVGNPATGINATGFLDQEESTVRFRTGPVLLSDYVDSEGQYLNEATWLLAAGGSFSGDGSDVIFTGTFLEVIAL